MIRFILELILFVLVFRMLARAFRALTRPRPRPFDPGEPPRREKSRDAGDISRDDIIDADYEDLPRK